MSRTVGTVVRGIRAPIFREGDDVEKIVTQTVLDCAKSENFTLGDRDVIAITEAVVARAQGNYATVDDIAADIKAKYPDGSIGLVFPITSRNRFASCLKGIARGVKKVTILLSYPSDEVGNGLISLEKLDASGINPGTELLDEKRYRDLFGENLHRFTGVDYVAYYHEIVAGEGAECEIIFSNNPTDILRYTPHVLTCDVHERDRTKRLITEAGARAVYGLDNILSAPVNGSGFNPLYGLLGSNVATEEKVKLFPAPGDGLVLGIQKRIYEATGAKVEVMIFGDGAFKDPVGKIWELADPVVSPSYTPGLDGTPNELKLKYLADNRFAHLSGSELSAAVAEYIKENSDGNIAQNAADSKGTTPRRITDLLGSLCDLTTGSGDKGTPIVLVQGYFDKYGA